MKKKIINFIVIVFSLFILILTLLNKTLVYDSINYSLNLWVKNIIPSLFPFFIISDILINYDITKYIPKFIKDIFKYLFNINEECLTIFLLSMISGFPSNARNTRIMLEKKKISIDDANHILIFSHFSNPLFILATIPIFFFHNENVGIILLISHYLSNIFLGIIVRKKGKLKFNFIQNNTSNNKFSEIFISSIKKSINTITTIGGIVTVFLVLSSLITHFLNLNDYNSMLIKGLMEMTIGIDSLASLNISLIYKLTITSMFLAFGGLSVHMQVINEIIETDIKYSYYFVGRIMQMFISFLITFIICLII